MQYYRYASCSCLLFDNTLFCITVLRQESVIKEPFRYYITLLSIYGEVYTVVSLTMHLHRKTGKTFF